MRGLHVPWRPACLLGVGRFNNRHSARNQAPGLPPPGTLPVVDPRLWRSARCPTGTRACPAHMTGGNPMVSRGLLVRLEARSGKEADVEAFLLPRCPSCRGKLEPPRGSPCASGGASTASSTSSRTTKHVTPTSPDRWPRRSRSTRMSSSRRHRGFRSSSCSRTNTRRECWTAYP